MDQLIIIVFFEVNIALLIPTNHTLAVLHTHFSLSNGLLIEYAVFRVQVNVLQAVLFVSKNGKGKL